jgi:ribosome-associated translation inhibitor RaiA
MSTTNEKSTPDIKVESIGLEQRIEKAVNEYVEKKIEGRFATLEKALDEKVDAILKAKEIEVEKALRKGFGLETDPVMHQSDIIAYMRKVELEKAETLKKTPAAIEKAGPEGAGTAPNPIDNLMKQYGIGGKA